MGSGKSGGLLDSRLRSMVPLLPKHNKLGKCQEGEAFGKHQEGEAFEKNKEGEAFGKNQEGEAFGKNQEGKHQEGEALGKHQEGEALGKHQEGEALGKHQKGEALGKHQKGEGLGKHQKGEGLGKHQKGEGLGKYQKGEVLGKYQKGEVLGKYQKGWSSASSAVGDSLPLESPESPQLSERGDSGPSWGHKQQVTLHEKAIVTSGSSYCQNIVKPKKGAHFLDSCPYKEVVFHKCSLEADTRASPFMAGPAQSGKETKRTRRARRRSESRFSPPLPKPCQRTTVATSVATETTSSHAIDTRVESADQSASIHAPGGAENEHIHTQLAGHPVPVQQPRHPDREREKT
uniref:Uncharacterized protein n=1 Tax=Timema genevievae TaxID=629358 RepID=A0A7R9JWX7_TIMGE|nr:unnamed protein product [Timema genevievae]